MELKEVAQAKIDIAEYMKTAPDMDDKKVTLLTDPADLAAGKEILQPLRPVTEPMVVDKLGPNLRMNGFRWRNKNVFHTF
jgi:cytochrome c oxidase cbb3-type subunit 3